MKTVTLLILIFTISCRSNRPGTSLPETGEPEDHGVASSAHPLATEAGMEILRSGGNAFDAAVAIGASLNVVEPAMSGMGGYGTILIYDATSKTIRFLDSSGKIPINTNSDLMRPPAENYAQNRRGAKSVSTPGTVNAWYALSSEYGELKWKNLFIPAINLARNGFVAERNLAGSIHNAWNSFPEHARQIFGKDGYPISAGDTLFQNELANTLEIISEKGIGEFYRGEIAKAIDQAMKKSGGFLRMEDLMADKAEWWEPVFINYGDYQIYTASPPSTAFPSLIRLGVISRSDDPDIKHNSPEYLHLFAEVTKHAFWCRLKYAGDPEIKPPPIDMLLSKTYWDSVAAGIDLKEATPFIPPFLPEDTEQSHTTHFVVADRWGNIVSATQTLGNAFGSRIMPEGTGFWLNNSLAYCTFEPKGNPMDAIPGQRKLSGDCPTIILKEGVPWAALGTPGGHTIGQTVPQIVLNLIKFNMDLQEALEAPRISFIEPDYLAVEENIDESIIGILEKMGHSVRIVPGLGNAHALKVLTDDNGNIKGYEGAADPRGNGLAMEY